jgi:tetratricopeptide (TPR) repeat protein
VPGLQPLRKDLLEKALHYYQQMAEKRGDDPNITAGLAMAHLRLAHVYHEVNRNNDAVAALAACVAVAERLYRQYPAAREHHRKLAGRGPTNRRMQRSGVPPTDLQAAQRVQTKFIGLWEKFAEENPDELGFQRDLAIAHIFLGVIEMDLHRPDQSIACTRKAIAILDRLANQKGPWYRETLAFAYETMCRAGGYPNKAVPVEWIERPAALYESLVAEFPDVPMYQEGLAYLFSVEAGRLARDGRHQDAEVAIQRSLDLLKQLVARLPHVEKYRIALAGAYAAHAQILQESNRPDQAVELAKLAVDRAPDNANFVNTLGTAYYRAGDWKGAIETLTALSGTFLISL